MTYINTGRTWLELQWQHVRCTEPSEGSTDGITWWTVRLYIPEIAHTFGQDDEVYKARAGGGNRSTYMWTIWKASLYEITYLVMRSQNTTLKQLWLSDTWPIASQALWKQVKGEGVDLHTWNPNTYEAEAGVLHDQIGLHTALESLLGYRARLYLNKSKLMNRMRKRW